jgi:hypothetical protein
MWYIKFHKKTNGVLFFNIALLFLELFTSFCCSLSGWLQHIPVQISLEDVSFPLATVTNLLAKYRETGSVLDFPKFGRMKSVTYEAIHVSS